MMGYNDLLRGSRVPPLMAPGLSNPQKAVMPKDADHLIAELLVELGTVSRGVPRSPNRHLDQLRVFRQFALPLSRLKAL
jgi:hypothetical protein